MKNKQSPFFIGPSHLAEQPLRPRHDDGEIEAKDDDELDRRGKEVAAHRLDQPHDDARDEGPHDASEAAERHYDEGDEAEITAHLGEDVLKLARRAPATPTLVMPIPHARANMRSLLMPMRRAASLSSATASSAMPARVFLRNRKMRPLHTTAPAAATSWGRPI